jgi:hypothetical protein
VISAKPLSASMTSPDQRDGPDRRRRGVAAQDHRVSDDLALPLQAVEPGAHGGARDLQDRGELRDRAAAIVPEQGDEVLVERVHAALWAIAPARTRQTPPKSISLSCSE